MALGRVDMQLVRHLRRLVLCLMFISDMGAYQSAGMKACQYFEVKVRRRVDMLNKLELIMRREALYMAGLPPKSWHWV